MSIMETTQESLAKTIDGVQDAQKLEKAITTASIIWLVVTFALT